MSQKTVEIKLEESSYRVDIGYQFLSKKIFSDLLKNKEILLVYDKNIKELAFKHIEANLKNLTNQFHAIGLEASEKNKSQSS